MNYRIRWEIIQRFSGIKWTRSEVDACRGAFGRIEREVQPFGKWDVDLLASNYSEEVQIDVRAIVRRWQQVKKPGSGELDMALDQCDGDKKPRVSSGTYSYAGQPSTSARIRMTSVQGDPRRTRSLMILIGWSM